MSHSNVSLQSGDANQQTWINRRTAVRYRCAPATVGKIYLKPGENYLPVWVLNLCRSGTGVLLNSPLAAEQEIVVQITSPASNEKVAFPARVAHATQQLTGDWLVGLVFSEPLSEEVLDKLLY